jgi:hypothetical protein
MNHADNKELQKRLDRAAELVQVGSNYRHRNGNLYRVEAIVMREADLSIAVIYRGLVEPAVPWERAIEQFLERFHRVDLSVAPAG